MERQNKSFSNNSERSKYLFNLLINKKENNGTGIVEEIFHDEKD